MTSARLYPPWHSHHLAKRYLVHCVDSTWHHCPKRPYVSRTTLFVFPLLCLWWHPRVLLLGRSRLLGSALRLSRSCLLMPPGFLCHAGGWHLRSRPCVVLFFFRLPSSRGILTSQPYLSLVCRYNAEHDCTQKAYEEIFFKGHCCEVCKDAKYFLRTLRCSAFLLLP